MSRKKTELKTRRRQHIVVGSIALALLYDIFFVAGVRDLRIIVLLMVYSLGVYRLHIPSSRTFQLVLGILGVMFLLYVQQGASPTTEKAASWVFFLLLIGIIHQLRE